MGGTERTALSQLMDISNSGNVCYRKVILYLYLVNNEMI